MLKIKLTGDFLKLAPPGSEKGLVLLEYEAGQTLGGLLARLGVKDTGLKYIALVNNARQVQEYMLQDEDSVIVMPLLAGG